MIPLPVVFEVSGYLAMFRRPYTTTSSVSFPFAPPSAIAGLIAAILGFDNGADKKAWNAYYWEKMTGTQVALRIMNPISWQKAALNFRNIKDLSKSLYTQINHQFVRRPRYRIFVKGVLEKDLNSMLKNHECYYTPTLGPAYALCDFQYIGRFQEESCDVPVEVTTVVPFAEGLEIDPVKSKGIFRELVPFKLSKERDPLKAIRVYFRRNPDNGIFVQEKGDLEIAKCGEDVVAWFPAW